MNELNVYKRLQKCRAELKKLPIKESGNNTFAKYTYMELGDFLPHIIDLCDNNGLCPVISFRDTSASLTIFNSDKPEESVVFESPMSTAQLKGCHEIQNLGAVETYLRRYLYVTAFDIVEHDALDGTNGDDKQLDSKQKPAQQKPPQQQQAPQQKPLLDAILDRIDDYLGAKPDGTLFSVAEFEHWYTSDESPLAPHKKKLNAEDLSTANKRYGETKAALQEKWGAINNPKRQPVGSIEENF